MQKFPVPVDAGSDEAVVDVVLVIAGVAILVREVVDVGVVVGKVFISVVGVVVVVL